MLRDFVLRQVLKTLLSAFEPMAPTRANSLTLARARCGDRLRVKNICSTCTECVRLQELGFCENAEFCKVSDGCAIICSLYGMRVAIGRELGSHVEVELVAV